MADGLQITLRNVAFGFHSDVQDVQVFENFAAEIAVSNDGLTVLLGSNGIGKSVLAQLLAGILVPHHGAVSFARMEDSGPLRPHVVYIPQHLESLHDRMGIDFAQAIAAGAHWLFSPGAFRRRLQRQGVSIKALKSPCDKVPRVTLLMAAVVAADFARADLLILDEPLAQLSSEERTTLESFLEHRNQTARTPVLVIAHPSQCPRSRTSVLTLSTRDGSKLIAPDTPTPHNIYLAPEADPHDRRSFRPSLFEGNTPKGTFPVLENRVNRISAPSGITPGRLAGLLVRALKTGRPAKDGRYQLEITRDSLTDDDSLTVRLLPADAQTVVVLSQASLMDSILFDRWEEAPIGGFSRAIDRGVLREVWFREAAAFLPIQHDGNPDVRGCTLSGGNRQLLALRTVGYPLPDVLVAVNPYAGLDELNCERAQRFLEFAVVSGTVVVLVDSI